MKLIFFFYNLSLKISPPFILIFFSLNSFSKNFPFKIFLLKSLFFKTIFLSEFFFHLFLLRSFFFCLNLSLLFFFVSFSFFSFFHSLSLAFFFLLFPFWSTPSLSGFYSFLFFHVLKEGDLFLRPIFNISQSSGLNLSNIVQARSNFSFLAKIMDKNSHWINRRRIGSSHGESSHKRVYKCEVCVCVCVCMHTKNVYMCVYSHTLVFVHACVSMFKNECV